MTQEFPQNSTRRFKIFMADSTNPLVGKTGLVGSFTVYLAKDGGAEATVSPTIVERGRGWYEVTPIAAHRDTLGQNAWTFTATGAVDYPVKEVVVTVDAQTARFGAAAAGDAMTLTSGERTAVANAVEAAILNEADANQVLAAIQSQVAALFDSGADVSVVTLSNAIRDAILNRVLAGNHDTAGTVGKLIQNADVATSTRLPTSSYTAPDNAGISSAVSQTTGASIRTAVGLSSANLDTQLSGISTVTTRLSTMIVLDGAVWQYTANALELAPSGGGGGGGDATLANQITIINSIAALGLIALETSPDVVTGMPSSLIIGNDYIDDLNAHIPIYIRDSGGTPLTGLGSKLFSDGDFRPAVVFDCGSPNNRVVAQCTWVPPSGPTEGYIKVEIPSKQSMRAIPGTSVMQLTFNWTGITSVRSRQTVEWVEMS